MTIKKRTGVTNMLPTKTKIRSALISIMNIIILVISMTASYYIGYYRQDIDNMLSNKNENFDEIHQYETTSVSVTERNELMIIDRTTQSIEVYDDTVGLLIYNAYSNVLVYDKEFSDNDKNNN